MYCYACCRDLAPNLIADPESVDAVLKPLLTVNANGWEPGKPICLECLSRFYRVHNQLTDAFPNFEQQDLKVLPTPMRLDAPDTYRGRGVTIIAYLNTSI
jgi:hypothetical protein